ncbi:MAG TPA: hypothetical protein VIJ35_27015 [Bradyrhizobium sp.]
MRQPDWDIVRALPLFCNVSEETFIELATAGRIVLHDAADVLNELRVQESYL